MIDYLFIIIIIEIVLLLFILIKNNYLSLNTTLAVGLSLGYCFLNKNKNKIITGGKYGVNKNKIIKFNGEEYKIITLSKNTFPLLYNGLREIKSLDDIQEYKYSKDDTFNSVSLFLTPDVYMAKKYSIKFIRVYKLLKDIDLILIENNKQLNAEELDNLRKKNKRIFGVYINWNKQEEFSTYSYKRLTSKNDLEYIDVDVNFSLKSISKYLKLISIYTIENDEILNKNIKI